MKLVIGKSGFNALTETNPSNLKFSSDFNTLKYSSVGNSSQIILNADDGIIAGREIITHNLGYIPYVEVYVSVNGGNYEYCPFSGAGARIGYLATYAITTTQLNLYAEIDGKVSLDFTFDFKYFLFKNKLNL